MHEDCHACSCGSQVDVRELIKPHRGPSPGALQQQSPNALIPPRQRTAAHEIRAQLGREPDPGDLLIILASAVERRRIERDLHDGAQQRFVTLSLTLALLDRGLGDDSAPAQRRLLPPLASSSTLDCSSCASSRAGSIRRCSPNGGPRRRSKRWPIGPPIDASVLEVPDQRLPAQVETAAYFIVAESLTNAVKHARAATATVWIGRANGAATIEVRDDGVGAPTRPRGSGLRGLLHRLTALDGALEVHSPAGGGT